MSKPKDFTVDLSLNLTNIERSENYASSKDVLKINVKKTLISDNFSKKEDFLLELKSSIEEVWKKANDFFKQRNDIFENKEEKEEIF